MIEWFAKNPVAANILMIGIVIAGITSASNSVPVETFPSDDPDSVSIQTQFRGATPQNVEDAITLRIEEAIADIEGIDEISSRSQEDASIIVVEVNSAYDERDVLDDIKVRVDALSTLPVDAEKPVIALNTRERDVVQVAIQGDETIDFKTLRNLADKFRTGLLSQSEITTVRITGVPDYEMNIEVSPANLDRFNLTLEQVGRAIRAGASDIAAGTIQSADGDILLRSNGQAYTAAEFAQIPISTSLEGKAITLGEIANIEDGFEQKPVATNFNGNQAVMVEVFRVGDQSALKVAEQTHKYIDSFRNNLPSGVSVTAWRDRAAYLETRLGAVLNSAIYGGLLVIILLSLFLRPAVAFWVCLGIPVSFMGAFLFMGWVGGSFNVVSLFAFILVIGIVVDDAIVTGENIYRRMREGLAPLQASIQGTKEIAVPVTFGVLTTAAAFIPLQFMDGTRLSFIAGQMPMVIIPVLLMSLVESKLVLPSHLSHVKPREETQHLNLLMRTQQRISRSLEYFIDHVYRPFLERCLDNRPICLAILISITLVVIAALSFGQIKTSPFPRITGESVRINLEMPESTGFSTTKEHIDYIVSKFQILQDKYRDPVTGESAIENIHATVGSQGRRVKANIGRVTAELQPAQERVMNVPVHQVSREVRKLVGEIPGAQSVGVQFHRGRYVAPINIEISGDLGDQAIDLINDLKQRLSTYPELYDIRDNFSGGKEELKLSLKPRAYNLGFTLNDVASQVRNAVFGFQAQRIQRGRDELRVMVRYPQSYRSSIVDLKQVRVRVPNSSEEVLLDEIASITQIESPSALYRLNQTSILNVTADLDTNNVDAGPIIADLNRYIRSIKGAYPNFSYRFNGDVQDDKETKERQMLGAIFIFLAIYALLAIPFKSYALPFVVMSVIPFGIIGAIIGHVIIGLHVTNLSYFGMMALIGVMVNDSLVLVDYINQRRAQGKEVVAAVIEAATVRFRPVLLTSLTTFAGLLPILLDGSQQAKWLKPMSTSLAFGILFATLITLIIVPVNYLTARSLKYAWLRIWNDEPRAKSEGIR